MEHKNRRWRDRERERNIDRLKAERNNFSIFPWIDYFIHGMHLKSQYEITIWMRFFFSESWFYGRGMGMRNIESCTFSHCIWIQFASIDLQSCSSFNPNKSTKNVSNALKNCQLLHKVWENPENGVGSVGWRSFIRSTFPITFHCKSIEILWWRK